MHIVRLLDLTVQPISDYLQYVAVSFEKLYVESI